MRIKEYVRGNFIVVPVTEKKKSKRLPQYGHVINTEG